MLEDKQRLILQLMSEDREKWWSGPDLMRASGGQLRHATVYVPLIKLVEAGHVILRDTGQSGSRLYQITESGMVAKDAEN